MEIVSKDDIYLKRILEYDPETESLITRDEKVGVGIAGEDGLGLAGAVLIDEGEYGCPRH